MSCTSVPQRACEDAVMALELRLDEHLNKVGRLVRSLVVNRCPHHRDPTPSAANIHDLLDTTAILSRNRNAGAYPVSNELQVSPCHAHFRKILDAANADPQNVVRVKMFLRKFGAWLQINPHWLEMFPDLQSRPTRHTIRSKLHEGRIIQMVATAIPTEG